MTETVQLDILISVPGFNTATKASVADGTLCQGGEAMKSVACKIRGIDCAEEVAVLQRALGPEE